MLPPEVQEAVVAAIREAELRTTGEIRIFIEQRCAFMDALDRAVELFASLGMEQTEERNAILVYVAIKDHQFAIFGDEAIFNQAGGAAFWKGAASILQAALRRGDLAGGLVACIGDLGSALARSFPYHSDVEKNELPDEIVFGK